MAVIVAALVAVVATPVAARLATRLGAVDRPGPLKVHRRPVPYFGGVAVFVAVALPLAGERPSLLLPLGAAAVLGLADDLGDLPPWLRLLAEVAIGAGAAWAAGRHDAAHVAVGVLAVVVLVNAVNLLDGLDGLSSSVAIAGALGFFVVLDGAGATLALALAGALAGFLVWNAPPARVYLGDSGSYLVGTVLGTLFVTAAARPAPAAAAAWLFVGVPVADTAVAILRRLRARRPLLQGDRGHVYDQLVDRGWTALAAVAACLAVQAGLTGIGIGVSTLGRRTAIGVMVATVAVVGLLAIGAFTSPRSWTPEAGAGRRDA